MSVARMITSSSASLTAHDMRGSAFAPNSATLHGGRVLELGPPGVQSALRAPCVQACACVDKCLQELLDVCDEVNARWLVTSDHGNADDMVQRTKKGEPIFEEGKAVPLTSHTLAPVGVAVGGKDLPSSVKARSHPPLLDRPGSRSVPHSAKCGRVANWFVLTVCVTV